MITSRCKMALKPMVLIFCLLPIRCPAQSGTVEPDARKQIDAGIQAWVEGMKNGDVSRIAATYTDDALECGSTGECFSGRAAIRQHLEKRLEELGRAQSALSASVGSVQQGDFVYEWGHSEASFANGKKIVHRYLTVWRRDAGGWKIFRNLVMPDDRLPGGITVPQRQSCIRIRRNACRIHC